MPTHRGGCHCGAITFEFDGPREVSQTDCNCSICNMTGFQHIFVPGETFRITRGAGTLSTYTFGTHTAKHMFCSICGVKAFYIPRSHPGGYSVNLRCITPGTLTVSHVIPFDGQHWDDNIKSLIEDT